MYKVNVVNAKDAPWTEETISLLAIVVQLVDALFFVFLAQSLDIGNGTRIRKHA